MYMHTVANDTFVPTAVRMMKSVVNVMEKLHVVEMTNLKILYVAENLAT